MGKELDMRLTLDGASARRQRPLRNRCRAGGRRRPGVECLEDRTLMTVAFQPVWGPETAFDNGGPKMSSPPVYLLFWGSYWKSAQGVTDKASILYNVVSFRRACKKWPRRQAGRLASGR
jgi:hypothetical protein